MKYKLISLILLLTACADPSYDHGLVQISGSLKDIMHGGDLQAKAWLDSLAVPGVYGLGALDSLRGEILIENGVPWVSMVTDGGLALQQNSHEHAGLLAHASVVQWSKHNVSGADLEHIILKSASKDGLTSPYLFILKGSFEKLAYHVINFDVTSSDLSNHKAGAYDAQLDRAPVTIIGFFSKHHQGRFTHHGSNLHMHVINDQKTVMGHVDHLETGTSPFTLLLPKL